VEAQIDWSEAYAISPVSESSCKCLGCAAWASGAAFHCAYLHATQRAFLEAHDPAFAYFGGAFHKLRYDNLTSAVKRILRGTSGRRRLASLRSVRIGASKRSFVRPAEPHENGGIKGESL
jgi:transposase